MTFYEILGVPRSASPEEIRAAYRALARRYHPDSLNGCGPSEREAADENIKAINAAFHTLGDPKRRQAYHAVMWSRSDPARQYRYHRPANAAPSPEPNGHAANGRHQTRPSSQEAKALYLEILKVRSEKDNLIERHAVRRRRLWMSTGFTSLIVYLLIAFGSQIYATTDELLSLTLYFVGVELITLSIILNASGMRSVRFPFVGNPIAFSIAVSVGMIVTCSSIPSIEMGLSAASSLFRGIVISAALLIHLFLATRLGRVQDLEFEARRGEILARLAELEKRFEQSKGKR